MARCMTNNECNRAIDLYLGGASLKKCGHAVGYSSAAIWDLLRRRKIPRRPIGRYRCCVVNEEFFSVIDSEERAYWLGFISADGTIHNDNVITLTLAIKDAEHIRDFSKALDSTYKVSELHYETYSVCTASIVSRKLVAQLGALGVVARKSLTIQPAIVDRALERHYWRGVVDGDGSIHIRANGYYVINLVGTKAMLRGFTAAIEQQVGLPQPKLTPNGSIYITSYANAKARRVTDWLYSDATVGLARKIEKAEVALASV